MTITATTWTRADSRAANAEGWDIFECDGSANGPYQLCKIDDPQEFTACYGTVFSHIWEDDTDAWLYVREHPTALHSRALAYLKQVNPQEHDAIMKWRR